MESSFVDAKSASPTCSWWYTLFHFFLAFLERGTTFCGLICLSLDVTLLLCVSLQIRNCGCVQQDPLTVSHLPLKQKPDHWESSMKQCSSFPSASILCTTKYEPSTLCHMGRVHPKQKLSTTKGRPYLDSTDSTLVMIMSHYSSDVQVAVRTWQHPVFCQIQSWCPCVCSRYKSLLINADVWGFKGWGSYLATTDLIKISVFWYFPITWLFILNLFRVHFWWVACSGTR